MKIAHVIAAALLVGQAVPALAQERPVAAQMSCASVTAMVQSQGEVDLTTGQYGFERVVRENSFCATDEFTSPAYVRTSDQQSCFAGYRCRPVEHGESRD